MSRRDFSDQEWEKYEREDEAGRSRMRENVTDATSRIRERGAEAARSASERIQEGSEYVADSIDRTAAKVRDTAVQAGNPTVTKIATRAASGLERGADYLREGGLDDLKADVENVVRTRPAESLIAALAVGFFLGKIIRR